MLTMCDMCAEENWGGEGILWKKGGNKARKEIMKGFF